MANQITTNQLIVIGVIAFVLFGNGFGGQQVTDNDNGNGNGGVPTGGVPSAGCAQTPEVTLQAADKWDSSVAISVSHRYILNSGLPTTYSTSFEASLDDTVKVLWANGNSTIYNKIDTYTIEKCENKIFVNDQLVRNTSFTIQCFNEEDNLITSGEQETVDAGDSVSLNCEIKGVFEKGMPHGGVMVVEMNATEYDEEQTALTGDIIGDKTNVPNFYTLATANAKARAWDVNPVMSSGTRKFTFDFQADSNNEPEDGAADITLKLYSIDCFEDTETNDFRCAIMTEDDALAGDLIGTATVYID